MKTREDLKKMDSRDKINRYKKAHAFVALFLLASLAYIVYSALAHHIFMAGYMVANIFMLAIEAKLYFE